MCVEMTPLIAAEGQHVQREMAALRPTAKEDRVDDFAATQWVEKLLKSHREVANR